MTAFDKSGLVVPTLPISVYRTDTDGVPTDPLTSGVMIRESAESDYVPTGTARDYVVTILPQAADGNGDAPIVAKVILTVKQLTTNDPTAVDAKGALVKTKLSSYTRAITLTAVPAG